MSTSDGGMLSRRNGKVGRAMTGDDFGQALMDAAARKKARSGEAVITLSALEALVRAALNPKAEIEYGAPVFRQLPVTPDYPRLKVRYEPGKPWIEVERRIVNSINEEVPYMSGGWYTVAMSTPAPPVKEPTEEPAKGNTVTR
jgi:hypothetical protein